MPRGAPIFLPGLLAACLLAAPGCHMIAPEVSHQPLLHNPFPQFSRVAVAPFANQSDEPTVDGRAFAMAYFAELQDVRGFEVAPVGVVEEAIIRHAIDLSSPGEARRLAEVLGVDAVVVGAVTDYSPYYPPRCGMRVEWYAANPGFHEIPAGYGLPWGTRHEEYIPEALVFEAEMALARAQMQTQTPDCHNTCQPLAPPPMGQPMGASPSPPQMLSPPHAARPIPTEPPRAEQPRGRAPSDGGGASSPPPAESGDGWQSSGDADAGSGGNGAAGRAPTQPDSPSTQPPSAPTQSLPPINGDAPAGAPAGEAETLPVPPSPGPLFIDPSTDGSASAGRGGGAGVASRGGGATGAVRLAQHNAPIDPRAVPAPPVAGATGPGVPGMPGGAIDPAAMLPPGWPDARGFTPPGPSPVRPPCVPHHGPVMTHTRIYRGHDPDFTAALASYVSFRDDARFGGWQSYLERSDDFIRFCAHLHLAEMLSARGGGGETRVTRRWSLSR
ncbi:MAG: hypothetical protein AAF790_09360 [Planctomycetota bacterium]